MPSEARHEVIEAAIVEAFEVAPPSKDTYLDQMPAWSPDGSRIASTSNRDGDSSIYVMGTDGSNVVRLTDDPTDEYDPAWSPAGNRIAFTSDRDGDKADIYVMDADGSNVTRLTPVVPD